MSNVRRLVVLGESLAEKYAAQDDGYGGKGAFTLPPDHKAAMVLKGGGTFSCANCKFVNVEKHECNSEHYILWNGGDKKLPDAPLEKICSDWFKEK